MNEAFGVMDLNNLVKRYIQWTELMGRVKVSFKF